MTVELLRLCNSAFYSRGREIASVDEAVVRLGNGPILQLVLAAYSRTLLAPAQTGWGLPPGALWRHSVGVALASRALGRGLSTEEAGAAFTAGLLHDVGKVALNEFMTRRFAAVAFSASVMMMVLSAAPLRTGWEAVRLGSGEPIRGISRVGGRRSSIGLAFAGGFSAPSRVFWREGDWAGEDFERRLSTACLDIL